MSPAVVGGASIHDESFDDEFSDMEGSITDGNAGITKNSICNVSTMLASEFTYSKYLHVLVCIV